MVVVCLGEPAGWSDFILTMHDIAYEERLILSDSSGATRRNSEALGDQPRFRTVNLMVYEPQDRFNLGVSHLDDAGAQLVVGFNGSDDAEIATFAERVVSELRETWAVTDVPEGQGAFPLDSCPVIAR